MSAPTEPTLERWHRTLWGPDESEGARGGRVLLRDLVRAAKNAQVGPSDGELLLLYRWTDYGVEVELVEVTDDEAAVTERNRVAADAFAVEQSARHEREGSIMERFMEIMESDPDRAAAMVSGNKEQGT